VRRSLRAGLGSGLIHGGYEATESVIVPRQLLGDLASNIVQQTFKHCHPVLIK
jgi:hypothetical protein